MEFYLQRKDYAHISWKIFQKYLKRNLWKFFLNCCLNVAESRLKEVTLLTLMGFKSPLGCIFRVLWICCSPNGTQDVTRRFLFLWLEINPPLYMVYLGNLHSFWGCCLPGEAKTLFWDSRNHEGCKRLRNGRRKRRNTFLELNSLVVGWHLLTIFLTGKKAENPGKVRSACWPNCLPVSNFNWNEVCFIEFAYKICWIYVDSWKYATHLLLAVSLIPKTN